ncbi:unnamed protein product [Taenia asiatica]|uniref:Uncharacterized protein n=1 Tax=Taenia asiatica TaxID=60517 RepID=A0A0R3W074_TAEAS|nr:unnamed protein product [Taenia asiatica]
MTRPRIDQRVHSCQLLRGCLVGEAKAVMVVVVLVVMVAVVVMVVVVVVVVGRPMRAVTREKALVQLEQPAEHQIDGTRIVSGDHEDEDEDGDGDGDGGEDNDDDDDDDDDDCTCS